MSVQSEIERITGEVESQADLISQIKTALEGKAGGSGGGGYEETTITPDSLTSVIFTRNGIFTGSTTVGIGDFIVILTIGAGGANVTVNTTNMELIEADISRANGYSSCVCLITGENPSYTITFSGFDQ